MKLFQRTPNKSQNRNSTRDSGSFNEPLSRQGTSTKSFNSNSSDSLSSPGGRWNFDDMDRQSSMPNRSRSNTLSSITSAASTLSSGEGSIRRSLRRESSIDVGSKWEQSGYNPKSFFSRSSRILRRKDSKMSLSSISRGTLDGIEESTSQWGETPVEEDGFRKSHMYHRSANSGETAPVKPSISRPYNFQHLTHTHSKHFEQLERTELRELATEFSVIRAGQAPLRELKGIRAEDLHFTNFSSSSVPVEHLVDGDYALRTDPNQWKTPELCEDAFEPHMSGQRTLRQTRSVENFSRNSPTRHRRSRMSPVPPPRSSSKAAITLGMDLPLRSYTSQDTSINSPFDNCTRTYDLPAGMRQISPEMAKVQSSSDQSAHAVTTPDDSAWLLITPESATFGADLDAVPEEDEGSVYTSASRRSVIHAPVGSLRHAGSLSNLREEAKVRPQTSAVCRGFDVHSGLDRPSSRLSETLGHCGRREETADLGPSVPNNRLSMALKLNYASWEDDIDYCYEVAAEANCDFDWGRKSNDIADRPKTAGAVPGDHDDLFSNSPSMQPPPLPVNRKRFSIKPQPAAANPAIPERASLLDPKQLITPHIIAPSPAESFSTDGTEVLTPSLSTEPIATSSHFDFTNEKTAFDTGVVIANDYGSDSFHETNMLSTEDSGHPFPYYGPVLNSRSSGAESLSSTRSPLSEYNSRESLRFSRGTAGTCPRSVNSFDSLPELVYSRNMPEECKSVVEPITEVIEPSKPIEASFSGPVLHRRTSSAAKSRAPPPSPLGITLDPSEPVSSQMTTPSHKRSKARSDEAGKLLNSVAQHEGPRDPRLGKRRTKSVSSAHANAPRNSPTSYTLFPVPTPARTSSRQAVVVGPSGST